MDRERYEALKRMAAPDSGATDNERKIAEALLENADSVRKLKERTRENRITVDKGISGSSIIVRRKDGKGACTIMVPTEEYAALQFCCNSLRMKLTLEEEDLVCERLA